MAKTIAEILANLPPELRPIAQMIAKSLAQKTAEEFVAWITILAQDPLAAYRELLASATNEDFIAAGEALDAYWAANNLDTEAQRASTKNLLLSGLQIVLALAAGAVGL
jgi:hypothetical protein